MPSLTGRRLRLDRLSDRIIAVLRRQAEHQHALNWTAGEQSHDQDLVFTRRDGHPLRPEYTGRHRLCR